jgi:D-alanyl-D-alanine carboxypeptidase
MLGSAALGASASDLAVAARAAAASATPLPACVHDDLPAPHAGLDDWATTLVDTAHALPGGYRPPDLVPVARAGIGGWGLVRSVVIDDLRALARDAARAGNPLAVQSAFRSRSRQAEVFAGWVASSGEAAARRFSARPGHSEHQLGTSLDLRAAAGGAPWGGAFGTTAAGRWLAGHAAAYGFVLSYPAGAEDVTCYGAEAWHVRYVGRAIAAEVAASGVPLRAWLWSHDADD